MMAKKAKQTSKETGEKPFVLIVEDEQFLCNLLVRKLENSGLNVKGVFDSEMAFEAVAKKRPGLILLDILLPGMDGFEVLRRFKADANLKSIPIIILSNLGEPRDIDKAMKAGAAAYLVKANNSPDQVLKKVREFV